MSAFPCVGCGACCRLVARAPETAHLDRGDGICRHLTDDNRCSIYDKRPTACRVDAMCPPALEMSEWYRRNVDACGRLHLEVYGTPMGG